MRTPGAEDEIHLAADQSVLVNTGTKAEKEPVHINSGPKHEHRKR